MNRIILIIWVTLPFVGYGQSYTSYLTGGTADFVSTPRGGICLMGGATEDDHAMRWFLQQAAGGDILVLRATGAGGYNTYLYSELGVSVNSVETIVCHSPAASHDPYVLQKIHQAEGIWFAGGNQWTYINYWRNTPVDSAINQAITQRNIVIGGTSAGMAIQGQYYFSAQNGTVSSAAALANPFHGQVTVDAAPFLNNYFLRQTITDTHFDNPSRKGRLVSFLARIHAEEGVFGKAIACDEYTAVCIDADGIAKVFGGFPTYDDNAYFVQSNCELVNPAPENCSFGNPLTWNLDGKALKVYQIKGDESGSKSFDLNDWQSGEGGIWHQWSVTNGTFSEQLGTPILCTPSSGSDYEAPSPVELYPNPASDVLHITWHRPINDEYRIILYDSTGRQVASKTVNTAPLIVLDMAILKPGLYYWVLHGKNGPTYSGKIIKLNG
jgi:cyanophycinase-like exopeptidase